MLVIQQRTQVTLLGKLKKGEVPGKACDKMCYLSWTLLGKFSICSEGWKSK